jgi:hypothetical protein
MSDMQKCEKLKIVVSGVCSAGSFCHRGVVYFSSGHGSTRSVPSSFSCHCIGGTLGFIGGILFLRN